MKINQSWGQVYFQMLKYLKMLTFWHRPTFSELTQHFQRIEADHKNGILQNTFCYQEAEDLENEERASPQPRSAFANR